MGVVELACNGLLGIGDLPSQRGDDGGGAESGNDASVAESSDASTNTQDDAPPDVEDVIVPHGDGCCGDPCDSGLQCYNGCCCSLSSACDLRRDCNNAGGTCN